MKKLNFDLSEARELQLCREKVRKENLEYRQSHPEIHDIVSGFTSALIREKPEDVFRFAFEHFRMFAKGEMAELITPKLKMRCNLRISGKDFEVEVHECFDRARWLSVTTRPLPSRNRRTVSEFSETFLLSTLRGCNSKSDAIYVAKRLVRRLCLKCKDEVTIEKYGIFDSRPDGLYHVVSPYLEECRAVLNLQCAWRSYKARVITSFKRTRYRAAVTLQCFYLTNKALDTTATLRRRRDGAITIQRRIRGGQSRLKVLKMLEGDTHYY